MAQKISIFLLLLSLPMACKKSEPTSSKKESVTERPTEVSGGFGLTMQCTVTNRDVPNSTSSEIACIVSNDDGTKFTGSYKDLKASVTARNASNKIQITPSQATNDSPVSLIVSVPGVKPDDSLSIQVEGKFDDAPAILSASLLGPFALTCSRDVNYWVESGAPDPTNLTCSEQKPCRSIGQAVALIPDIINCNLTINVKPGTYEEALTIASREIRPNKTIRIRGVDDEQTKDVIETPVIKAPDDLPKATPDEITESFADKGLRTAVQINSILAKNAFIEFENIEIQGGADLERAIPATGNDPAKSMYDVSKETVGRLETGIYASTTALKLTNVKLTGFSHVALLLDQSSRLVISSPDTRPALEINKSRVGLSARDVDRIFFGDETKIIGNGDIQDGAGVDLARVTNVRFFDESSLTIKDLRYGLIADKSLIIPTVQLNSDTPKTARIEIENVFTGLRLVNNSEFLWQPRLSETKTSELRIKNCYHSCIHANNSILNLSSEVVDPASSKKKRLVLELDSRTTGEDRYSNNPHFGLLLAENRSQISFSQLENRWCNIGNLSKSSFREKGDFPYSGFYAMSIISDSFLEHTRYDEYDREIMPNCEDSYTAVMQYIRHFEDTLGQNVISPINVTHLCPFGAHEELEVISADTLTTRGCYLNTGKSVRKTLYPSNDNLKFEPRKMTGNLEFKLPDPNSPLITNGTFRTSTAGGDLLEINTAGFHSITLVKVDGNSVPINSFNPNFSSDRQRVVITAPPHTETFYLRLNQQVSLEVLGLSLADPTKEVRAKNQITYVKECPENYFQVATNSALSTELFCVMSYEAKDQSSRIVSEPTGLPLVNISRAAANAKCQSISPYYRLMSNAEWQAMARKTETLLTSGYLANWNDTDTFMRMGHSDNDPAGPLTASNDNWPCFGTEDGVTSGTTCDPTQWRYLRISDDARVWDIAGNVAEWVSDNYTVTGTPDADTYISQITDSTLKSKFGPTGDYSGYSEFYAGLGYLKVNTPAGTYGIARGGSYLDEDSRSGVFAADATLDPSQGYPNVGFRCVVVPPATVP
jgi:formylglycine-generating enzyme required for sulfatase activity